MSCKISFADGEDGSAGLKNAGRHALAGQPGAGWQRPGGTEVLKAVEGVLMNSGPWFLTYNSAAGHMSKSTPELSLLSTSNTREGEDDGVAVDLKPRRLHRSTRNRSPETKHHQQEDEEVGTFEDSRLAGMGVGTVGVTPAEASRTAAGVGQGEGPLDALLEGLTNELVSRILADVEDISMMNITEAELLSFARSELLAMAVDAEEQAADWASPAAPSSGARAPVGARDARQVKFSSALQAGASRRVKAPSQRTPTPVAEAKAAARQPLYPGAPCEEEADAAAASQAPRRGGARASARSSRAGAEGAERPGTAMAAEDAAAGARGPHGLADARLGAGSYAMPAQPDRVPKPAATPCSVPDGEARRALSPHALLSGSAGRGPRPTTPHKARPPEARLGAGQGSPEIAPGASAGAQTREGEAPQSPRQEWRAPGAQAQQQRRSAPALQPLGALQGAATPRSSARAAAVAAGLDPRFGAPPPRRAAQLSPSRSAALHGQQSHAPRASLHKSMSPSRSGIAARRVNSPRQATEHQYHDLSPGPATRLAAESGYLVADERDLGVPMQPKSALRSRGLQDAEASDGVQAQPRTIGSTPRALHAVPLGAPKGMTAAMNKAQQTKVKKAATAAATTAALCPPAAVMAGSRGYNLHGIAVGDEVGGIVTHTSWVGPFVNIGAEVDGFVDPVTLPDKLTLNPGDLICGLRVELVDVEKPKLLLDGKNAWIMTLASG